MDTVATQALSPVLSERELQILACLAEGLSNQEIAEHLHLALLTVKWYNSQIYSKLNVSNRNQAVVEAQALGLLATPADEQPGTQTRHNLPLQPTPFIGRAEELRDLALLLRKSDVTLVTILAPGGMGKTRLALEAARQQLTRFEDGVFFIPLAPLGSASDIITTIAEHVGFSFYGSETPRQQLLAYFRDRSALLVLDNCEHLLDGAPLLTELTQAAAKVKVLATSREKLNLSGETTYILGGMQCPDGETLADALEYDAVKLFVQSTLRVRPDFELQADNLKFVTRICRLTAGMPLGIVLAAGWLDVMTLEQITAEIEQGIDILETDLRDIPERQRSMRSTFNTSWTRLTGTEQDAFTQLSVFRGGFTAAAADAVTGADMRVLRKLVNKALVQADVNGRYTIQELLRQYGEDKLIQAGARDSVRQRHCAYFARFMQQREADVKGRRQREALNEIAADFANIRTAWNWAIAHGDDAALDDMLETLHLYCDMHARYPEGEQLFGQAVSALNSASAQARPAVWYRLRSREAAMWLLREDKLEEAVLQLQACQEMAQAQQDEVELAYCAFQLGEAARISRQIDLAIHLYEQGQDRFRLLGDRFYVGRTLRGLAYTYGLRPRQYADVKARLSQELLDLTRDIGDRTGMAHAICYLNVKTMNQGIYSWQSLGESQEIWQEMGDRKSVAWISYYQALLLFSSGELERAEEVARKSLMIGIDLNYLALRNSALALLSRCAAMREDYATAQAQARGANIDGYCPDTRLAGFLEASIVEVGLGNFPAVRPSLYHALQSAYDFCDTLAMLTCLPVAVALLAHDGQKARAVELLGLAMSRPLGLVGWMEKWPLLTRLRADLRAELGAEAFAAAWEQGASLDLDTVVSGLLTEYERTSMLQSYPLRE
jgi:predicted ATPase/DNA-binding CsgD family transcriptional regulator